MESASMITDGWQKADQTGGRGPAGATPAQPTGQQQQAIGLDTGRRSPLRAGLPNEPNQHRWSQMLHGAGGSRTTA